MAIRFAMLRVSAPVGFRHRGGKLPARLFSLTEQTPPPLSFTVASIAFLAGCLKVLPISLPANSDSGSMTTLLGCEGGGMFWILVSVIALGAAWYFLKRKKDVIEKSPDSASDPARKAKPIWGKQVIVPTNGTSCQAAKELAGKCFELDKLPSFPLAACTCKVSCLCHFEPLPEKRNKIERRSGKERRPALRFDPNATQRRSGKDRRYKNQDPFNP